MFEVLLLATLIIFISRASFYYGRKKAHLECYNKYIDSISIYNKIELDDYFEYLKDEAFDSRIFHWKKQKSNKKENDDNLIKEENIELRPVIDIQKYRELKRKDEKGPYWSNNND